MLPEISESVCRDLLEPYQAKFWECVVGAVADFLSLPADHLRIQSSKARTKANSIWAYMQDRAAVAFASEVSVVPHTKYGSTTYEIQGQMEFRLKKLNNAGYSRNYPTPRARNFHYALQYELMADCWSAPIRLDLGYVLDKLGQNVEQVLVAFRVGNFVEWSFEIPRPAEGVNVTPIGSPVAPTGVPVRVVAKPGSKRRVRKSAADAAS